MTDPTAIPADDDAERATAAERTADDLTGDVPSAEEERVDDEVAPEEELLEGWLPDATPTDGSAPAP
jgi:hypothetical protein